MNSSRHAKIHSIAVLIVAALILQVTMAVQYFSTRNAITSEIMEMAQRDVSTINRVAEVKKIAESALVQAAPEVERLFALGERDSLYRVLQQIVKDHPELVGIDFACRVGSDGKRDGYFTFRNEETGGIEDTIIGFDYTERSWYREGLKQNGFWTEPYMSHYYVILMSTYAYPVRNAKGEAVAVLGADVPMHELSAMTVQLYENMNHSLLPVLGLQLLGLLLLGFIMYRSIHSVRKLNEVSAEKELINKELDIANRIQAAMLPATTLITDSIDVAGSSQDAKDHIDIAGSQVPAKQVGGDFYDFFVRDGKLFFDIGDVCGKGIPAALVMSMTQAVFRSVAAKESSPGRILQDMNAVACRGNTTGMFTTLFVGVLNLATGTLQYSSAGHDKPYVISGKEMRQLEFTPGLPIGIVENQAYQDQETRVVSGDMLMLYTDGLTEAMNADKELFGQKRIAEAIKAQDSIVSPKQLLDTMSQAVTDFVCGAEQSDDLTMLAILYKGPAAGLAGK